MERPPRFKLSRLREIGWAHWDPIGLSSLLDEGNDSIVDEYDSYLLQAAGRLWNGAARGEVTDYLVEVERDHMGLGEGPRSHTRAVETVAAIGEYIAVLRGRAA